MKKPPLRLIGIIGFGSWLVTTSLVSPPWAASARVPVAGGSTTSRHR